jgi:hypothetical protein
LITAQVWHCNHVRLTSLSCGIDCYYSGNPSVTPAAPLHTSWGGFPMPYFVRMSISAATIRQCDPGCCALQPGHAQSLVARCLVCAVLQELRTPLTSLCRALSHICCPCAVVVWGIVAAATSHCLQGGTPIGCVLGVFRQVDGHPSELLRVAGQARSAARGHRLQCCGTPTAELPPARSGTCQLVKACTQAESSCA